LGGGARVLDQPQPLPPLQQLGCLALILDPGGIGKLAIGRPRPLADRLKHTQRPIRRLHTELL